MLGRCVGIGIADCICGGAGRSENTTLHCNAFLVLHFFLLSFLYLWRRILGSPQAIGSALVGATKIIHMTS